MRVAPSDHDGRADADAGSVAHVRRINRHMAEGRAEMPRRQLVLRPDQAAELYRELAELGSDDIRLIGKLDHRQKYPSEVLGMRIVIEP